MLVSAKEMLNKANPFCLRLRNFSPRLFWEFLKEQESI